jgi:hypothetical protein
MFAAAIYYKDLKNLIGAGQKRKPSMGCNTSSPRRAMVRAAPSRVWSSPTRRVSIPPGSCRMPRHVCQLRLRGVRREGICAGLGSVPSLARDNTPQLDLFYTRVASRRASRGNHSPTPWPRGWARRSWSWAVKTSRRQCSYRGTTSSVRLQGHNLSERGLLLSDNLQNLSNDGGYQVYGRSYHWTSASSSSIGNVCGGGSPAAFSATVPIQPGRSSALSPAACSAAGTSIGAESRTPHLPGGGMLEMAWTHLVLS